MGRKKKEEKKEETKEKKSFKKPFNSPTYWKVADKIWLQVGVADKDNYDVLKRSKRTNIVVQSFRTDGKSDEVVFELDEATMKDLGIKATYLSDRATKEERKETKKMGVTPVKVKLDRKAAIKFALAQTKTFKAEDVKSEVGGGLSAIRLVLGALVKKGYLISNRKRGYTPVKREESK